MTLQKLSLTNFKTFQREDLEFGPITLLTGANSSGKTSLLQALCAITQARTDGEGFPYDFRLNGPLVRLGDFRNVIHGHNTKASFSIGLEIRAEDLTVAVSGTYRKAEEGGAVATRGIRLQDQRAEVDIAWNQKQHAFFLQYHSVPGATQPDPSSVVDLFWSAGEASAEWLHVLRSATDVPPRARTAEGVLQKAVRTADFDVEKLAEFFRQQEEELKKGKIRLSASNFSDAMREVGKLSLVAAAANRVRRKVASQLRNVAYVGAVRAHPLRYYATSISLAGFDPYGEAATLRLAQWKERRRDRFNAVKDALIQLELATELFAETNLGEFVQVKITPKDRKYTDTIADVGFGVSQVLPMLVADVGLDPEGTLLINQPEVHLHPSSQALLGNYFASRLGSRQYIIETHSEYLITRFRILIAKGHLNPKDVRLYFVMPAADSAGKLLRRIEIGEHGELVDAPKDFFKTYISDSYELALSGFSES